MSIESTFVERHRRSAALYSKARQAIPSGINHDARYLHPFQLYVDRAEGVYKWDVDGNRVIDYVMGHGALLLGHAHPKVVDAATEQAVKGTHFGASNPLEVDWAERITALVPSAEEVRFTMSGTEATLLAMRLARAFTGRSRIVKFEGHFHGWHDYALIGDRPPFDRMPRGVPENVGDTMAVLPVNLQAVREALSAGDIAAIIVEPSGASWATVGLPDGFLPGLRQLATEYGALLTFDEVVSGFRWSPGGVQQAVGVTPDLTALAKIVAGGFPGGAVAGRRDVMELLAFDDRERKIIHQGTFNANPVSAAAGVACLSLVGDGAAQARAAEFAAQLRQGMNDIFCRLDVPGCAYGESSVFHLMTGVPPASGDIRTLDMPAATLKAGPPEAQQLEMAMLNHGVHLFHGTGGFVSSVAQPEQIAATLEAFEESLRDLRGEAVL